MINEATKHHFFSTRREGHSPTGSVLIGSCLNHSCFNSVPTLQVSKEAELRAHLPSTVRKISYSYSGRIGPLRIANIILNESPLVLSSFINLPKAVNLHYCKKNLGTLNVFLCVCTNNHRPFLAWTSSFIVVKSLTN